MANNTTRDILKDKNRRIERKNFEGSYTNVNNQNMINSIIEAEKNEDVVSEYLIDSDGNEKAGMSSIITKKYTDDEAIGVVDKMYKHGLLGSRFYYKPFQYPWAYTYFKMQNNAHWTAEEVSLTDDIKDFNTKLTQNEKNIVTQVLKFFTQGDLDVSNNYIFRLMEKFNLPEVQMMLSTFNAFEAIHINAYAYLSDSLNLDADNNFYKSFLDIKEMRDKHDYMAGLKVDNTADLAKVVAIFGGFIEGVQLFSSFAILNSFPRRNLLKNTAQIITWSIRDESLHSAAMTKLFRTLVEENPGIWDDKLKKEIYEACKHVVALEEAFIDVCFSMGDIEGLKAKDLKKYIHYLADVRIADLGLKPIYRVKKHNLQWLDNMINATEHANFFESRATNYSKGSIIDDMEE